jgi:hypothetical protein
MFGGLFGKQKTSKFDVVMAAAGAIIGVWKAFDTFKDYQADQEEENQQ